MDHSQSNRSSLDVSQSSNNTLIIHDHNESQPLFSSSSNPAGLFFMNSSPSPPNSGFKKDKTVSRLLGNYCGNNQVNDGNMMSRITENEQQYLNQSFVLKHLAKEVKLPHVQMATESKRDSGVSENHSLSNIENSAKDFMLAGKAKSKSQPDLTNITEKNESQEYVSCSTSNTLNFLDFEQLEVENTKLREKLNDCLMKVAKSQKVRYKIYNRFASI